MPKTTKATSTTTPVDAPGGAREIVFSFDTTGSMFPCLTQVRRNVSSTIKRLFDNALNVRVGVVAHGDYCDGARMISVHELSTNQASLCKFVENVQSTSGGDAPEAYEQVLHRARTFNWTGGHSKALVMIGDEVPHEASFRENRDHIDWRRETEALRDLGVKVYGVQCLNRRNATSFYRDISRISGGYHLQLDQFNNVTELLLAVGYQQQGEEQLAHYEEEVIAARRMNRNLDSIFATLRGRAASRVMGSTDLHAVPSGRFQILSVDRDMPIKDFCSSQGVEFKPGRGFYELTKSEKVQGTKEIVLMARASGDLFTGTRARELLGLPLDDEDVKLAATHLAEYVPFIQSTSVNRKLVGGTRLLYEVPDWDRADEPS
jgi:von Willebrand factor type A domain